MTCQGYIGVSVDHVVRWREHKNCPSNAHLKNAINKYGWDNLVREVILIADTDYCLTVEAKLRPTANLGWNIAAGGGKPPVTRWNLGKPHNDETRAKISRNRKGKKHTPEMQERLNINLLFGEKTRFEKGHVSWNAGKQFSKESIGKMRQAKRGKKFSDEHKLKLSEAKKGQTLSLETRQRISLANKGKPKSTLGKKFDKIECPHCGKTGGVTGMKSWHFDNCRVKEAA
jgi:group I intron endonuclease